MSADHRILRCWSFKVAEERDMRLKRPPKQPKDPPVKMEELEQLCVMKNPMNGGWT